MSVASTIASHAKVDSPIRVMVVDDAVVVRGLLGRWLTETGDVEIVASHRSGRPAVDDMERADPDIVILDIEMPDMDGIQALPLILQKKKNCIVIMASTLTRRNAEISLKCLSLGAMDYIPKPDSNRSLSTSPEFQRELIEKVRHLGRRAIALRSRSGPGAKIDARGNAARSTFRASQTAPTAGGFLAKERAATERTSSASPALKLRPFASVAPRVLVIGSSTGGPQALNQIVAGVAPLIDRVPVLITQHMPATFTTILAEHLGRASNHVAVEGQQGEPVRPGRIYVAPGGRHMRLKRGDGHAVITLDDGPLVNFCRPAVDPLFSSAAQVFGASVCALVLTGMGSDGAHGAGDIVAAGGSVVAQDEATSVVWGMPGAAAHAGHCSAVLPLDQIAPRLLRLFAGDRT